MLIRPAACGLRLSYGASNGLGWRAVRLIPRRSLSRRSGASPACRPARSTAEA